MSQLDGADHASDAMGDLLGVLLGAGLDHDPDQLLSSGWPQQDSSVVAEFRLGRCDGRLNRGRGGGDGFIRHADIDQNLRQTLHDRGQVG